MRAPYLCNEHRIHHTSREVTNHHFRIADHNAHPASSSSTHGTVILNAVKDLRLPLRVSMRRYFLIADDSPGIQ